MHTEEIQKRLIDHTVKNSHFESERNYIGLSKIAESVEDIIESYNNGFNGTLKSKLKCYKGYQMEADLKRRLSIIFKDDFIPNVEISAFDGKVMGHPDCRLFGRVTEIKSVLKDEHLPENNTLPKRVYWQMQGYLLFDNSKVGYVIYESRESGIPKVFVVTANDSIQTIIRKKLDEVMKRLYV